MLRHGIPREPHAGGSLGVCTKADNGTGTAQALLREADAQLYTAKSHGRNQACGAELPGV